MMENILVVNMVMVEIGNVIKDGTSKMNNQYI